MPSANSFTTPENLTTVHCLILFLFLFDNAKRNANETACKDAAPSERGAPSRPGAWAGYGSGFFSRTIVAGYGYVRRGGCDVVCLGALPTDDCCVLCWEKLGLLGVHFIRYVMGNCYMIMMFRVMGVILGYVKSD